MAQVKDANDVRRNPSTPIPSHKDFLTSKAKTSIAQSQTAARNASAKPASSGGNGGSSKPAATASPLGGFSGYRGSTIGTDNPVLKTLKELADKYEVTYDQSAIEKIFHDATTAQYDANKVAKNQEIDNFTRSLGASAQAMGQEMARARASGVMSGANTGMQATDALTAMTSYQQTTSADSLVLQQELYQLEGEYNAAIAQGTKDALEYANEIKQAMATLAAEIYGIDTQKYAAQLGYNAAIEEANTAASASEYATKTGAETTRYGIDQQAAAARAAASAGASAARSQAASYEYQARLNNAAMIFNTSLQNSNDPQAAANAFKIFMQSFVGK